ncbi:MAG: tetratricopeptide repeat protein, partial [Planctomycetales bacterium]|nr:tetratricopeptide repeat protein [Planctomycetales bacterium]
DLAGAISKLESEDASQPDNAQTLYLLAVAHRRSGHTRLFQEYLVRAKNLGYPQGEIERQILLLRLQSGAVSPDLEKLAEELIGRAGTYDGASVDLFVDEFYEARAQGHLANYRLFDAELALDHWLQARPESIPARLMRADILQRGVQLQAAEREYREILALDPGNVTARLLRARLLMINQKVPEAEQEFRICLQTAPQEVRAQLGLAECEFRNGSGTESARERLTALLEQNLDPRLRAETLFLLGQICRSQKKDELAIKYLTEGLELEAPSDSAPYQALSAAYAMLNKREEAAKYLKLSRDKMARDSRLLDIGTKIIQSPENAMLRFEQGNVYLEEGMKDEAAAWWTMAVRIDPRLQVAHEALAEFYSQKGDSERADYHRGLAEQSAEGTFDRLWRELLDSNTKAVREGLPQLTRYSGLHDQAELLTVGLDVIERKNLEHALPVLDRLARSPKLRLRVLTMRAEALYVTGHYKGAERDYLEVLSLSPRNIVAHRGLQAIYFDLADYRRMELHALQVAEIDPTDYRPHRHLGFLRREAETWEAAIADYKESLRRSPHQPSREEVLLEMADCYIHLLKYQEALDALTDARPSAQKSFLEAQCQFATKKVAEARKLLDESLKTWPDHAPSLLLRSDIALVESDESGARGFLQRAVAATPFDNNAHLKLSTVLLRLGEKEAAKKEGDRAKELLDLNLRFSELNGVASQRPTDISVRRELASLASQLGREEDAKRWNRVVDALVEDTKAVAKEKPFADVIPGTKRPQSPNLKKNIGPSNPSIKSEP